MIPPTYLELGMFLLVQNNEKDKGIQTHNKVKKKGAGGSVCWEDDIFEMNWPDRAANAKAT